MSYSLDDELEDLLFSVPSASSGTTFPEDFNRVDRDGDIGMGESSTMMNADHFNFENADNSSPPHNNHSTPQNINVVTSNGSNARASNNTTANLLKNSPNGLFIE